jgi:hypothetical protein
MMRWTEVIGLPRIRLLTESERIADAGPLQRDPTGARDARAAGWNS